MSLSIGNNIVYFNKYCYVSGERYMDLIKWVAVIGLTLKKIRLASSDISHTALKKSGGLLCSLK